MSRTLEQGASTATTHGFTVVVQPHYLPHQSKPDDGRYEWSYRVRVINESGITAQLLSRKWVIVNAEGDRREVDGPGVVGKQPVLAPGESFEYSSYCPLDTTWGTMEGSFEMRNSETEEHFRIEVARFYLIPKP
jgi:ApaG protein